MSRDVDELFEALERNTTAIEKLCRSTQDLCNSVNDMVVCMESAPEWDEEPEPDFDLSEFEFTPGGEGNA